jgi:hypothetical protein
MILQRFFAPAVYKNGYELKLKTGNFRQFYEMKVTLEFINGISWRIPFRNLSKANRVLIKGFCGYSVWKMLEGAGPQRGQFEGWSQ